MNDMNKGNDAQRRHNPFTVLKHCIVAAVIVLAVLALIYRHEISVSTLLSFKPETMVLAVLIMLLVYILKSITVVIDLKILYIASGILFPFPIAIAVNLAGVFLCMSISYLFGRYVLRESARSVLHRYPKLEKLQSLRARSDLRFACLLRAVAFLPSDPVSMYLGSVEMPFKPYIIGSLIGLFPAMCVTTYLGLSIQNPRSREFMIALAAFVIITVIAVILYYVWQRHSSRVNGTEDPNDRDAE